MNSWARTTALAATLCSIGVGCASISHLPAFTSFTHEKTTTSSYGQSAALLLSKAEYLHNEGEDTEALKHCELVQKLGGSADVARRNETLRKTILASQKRPDGKTRGSTPDVGGEEDSELRQPVRKAPTNSRPTTERRRLQDPELKANVISQRTPTADDVRAEPNETAARVDLPKTRETMYHPVVN